MREEAGREPLDEARATDEQFVLDASAWVRTIEPVVLHANVRNVLDSRFAF